jgi:bacterial/archaeal transporter family-2 protein
MLRALPYILGLVAGFGLSAQVGMNSTLRRAMQNANSAALASFLVGTVALLGLLIATRAEMPTRETLAAVPAWAWFGGLFGAFYVSTSTIVASQLGATSLLGLALLGQLITSLVLDHYGWLGLPVHPITFTRLAGVVLLGGGVWLISR